MFGSDGVEIISSNWFLKIVVGPLFDEDNRIIHRDDRSNFLQDTVLMHAQLQRLKNTYLCVYKQSSSAGYGKKNFGVLSWGFDEWMDS